MGTCVCYGPETKLGREREQFVHTPCVVHGLQCAHSVSGLCRYNLQFVLDFKHRKMAATTFKQVLDSKAYINSK